MGIRKYAVAIDPGVVTSGWALFDHNWIKLVDCGSVVLKGSKTRDPRHVAMDCATNVWNDIRAAVFKWRRAFEDEFIGLSMCACEFPQVFTGAAGIAAAGKSDVLNIAFSVGFHAAIAAAVDGEREFVPVPVNQWKGNMSKDLTLHRVKRILNQLGHSKKIITKCERVSHAADAVGIGLHVLGHKL